MNSKTLKELHKKLEALTKGEKVEILASEAWHLIIALDQLIIAHEEWERMHK